MGYMVKNKDSQKVITLTLTAEQLEVIDGALEMYCMGLAEQNDPHLTKANNAHEAIINNLEWHFGENRKEIEDIFNNLAELAEKGKTNQLNPFYGTKYEKEVIEIGCKIKQIGGSFALNKTIELFDAVYHRSFKGALFNYWSDFLE